VGNEIGKFYKTLDGERENEDILRKKKTHFKNELSSEDINTADKFAATHLSFIVGVMHNLKELSQSSQVLFTELLNDTQKITSKVEKIEARAKKCQETIATLEKQVEKEPKLFLQGMSAI
jgi:primosomal protein N''